MRAFLFPGQGSQAVGMGRDLAAASTVARETLEEVDDALGQKLSVLMAEGPEADLTLTANAQPAIMANAIATLRVMQREGGLDLGAKADALAGHSLGEYSALCAGESFDLATTARLLRVRGDAMQAAVPVGEGAMAALLGADLGAAQALCDAAAEGEVLAVANDNDPTQVVISGHAAAVERAIAVAKDHGIRRAVKLPVSAPFHSPLMAPAAEAMRAALEQHPPRAPRRPVWANVSAAPESDGARIAELLAEQVTGRVRWRETIAHMWEAGVTDFVEVGGKVLAPMVKRIAPDASVASIVTMDDIDAAMARL